MTESASDAKYMKLAIEQAKRGIGLTSPNPCVGALIVHEDSIVGAGFHERAGLPHAERMAIADGIKRGHASVFAQSTLYVTLEPCSTTGKTPPCTEAILEHKFKRVVYGSQDPNPRHRGIAEQIMRAAGIEVARGILEEECDHLIRSFRKNMLEGRPWVIAKSAMSLDGHVTRAPERSQWLTGMEAVAAVHGLRAECDAIITGGNTVRIDNPALTIRTPDREISPLKEQPWRIVLTKDAKSIPADSVCMTDRFKDRTLIVENVSNYLDLLKKLYQEKKIGTVLLEAGGGLMREFLQEKLVDEWVGFYVPMITGGGVNGVAVNGFLPSEAYLPYPVFKTYGSDICVRGAVEYR